MVRPSSATLPRPLPLTASLPSIRQVKPDRRHGPQQPSLRLMWILGPNLLRLSTSLNRALWSRCSRSATCRAGPSCSLLASTRASCASSTGKPASANEYFYYASL